MKSELQLLKEANDILRSVNSIIKRKGKTTNWEGIDKKVKMALAEQHELLLAKKLHKPLVIKSVCDCPHKERIPLTEDNKRCSKCGKKV